ncbi:LysR family transcriptional regulator [Azoarcus sp. L1K30]|uniref:LysR family transcriptional regulator n=1 Tax=Azoarcus sp. L1K30 TaxID=2820277 RepID=UPI001B83C751|nr:LysR family transcriptional regulator [Azoarcus sp. L1K30]MBR0566164.1 LysR family transcriptional regulator [Azoarcus sp. L1K30]
MQLRDLDLNLLLVFNQLLIDKRVSAVAEALGLTQPAVSNALKRLRTHLRDELFVRTARGMEPTPYALQLAEPVSYALSAIHSALNQQSTFDPASSDRTFTLAVTDIGEIYFLPTLMGVVSSAAPGIRISTVRNTGASLKEDMEAGRVDLAVGLLPQLQAGFFQQRLFRQRYVCLFRRGHVAANEPMTLDRFQSLEHVVVVSAGTGHGEVDTLLDRAGVRRRVRMVVPHFIAVGHILQSTDLIATVPERFAACCTGPFDLVTTAHPATLPEIPINLFWHAKYHRDPANRWLRQLLFERFSDGAKLGPAVDG